MAQILASVGVLLLAVGLLMLASGMFGTFIGLRSSLEGFSQTVVGLMMSAYYLGLILGTLRIGPLINRIGHIRAFAAFSASAAAAAIAFPFMISAPVWIILRGILGFSMAGLFMVVESWLNERATGETRGTIMSLYMMISYLAMGSGQFLLNLGNPLGLELFMLATLLFCLALIPVAVTRAVHPVPVESSHFPFRRLYDISPTAVIGCLCAGLCSGAVYGMGPVFAKNLGMTVAEISRFMGIVIISGLFLQLPIGRLSDRFDRRLVIILVSLATAGSCAGMVLLMRASSYEMMTPAGPVSSLWEMRSIHIQAVAAAFGGFVATLYPLSVAYANDYIESKDMVQATGGLVLAFGIGAASGPVAAGFIMRLMGPAGLFLFAGAAAAALAVFALYRTRRRSWVPVAEKESFVLMPDALAMPLAVELDPRTEESSPQLELDFGAAATAEPEQPQPGTSG